MKSIDRMLINDICRMWRQGLAISALLACGISIFIMSRNAMESLETSRKDYYQDGNFGDVFAALVRAPETLSKRILEIDGVRRVQTRVVRDVMLDIPEMVEPATGKLVSIDGDQRHALNRVFLRKGRWPESRGRAEVLVSELFAEAHDFSPGDSFRAIIGGQLQTLNIVGVGQSAEFVYVTQPGQMVTDNRRYGVIWMPRDQLAAAFNMEGAFNHLSVQLSADAIAAQVIDHIDRQTRDYGGTGAFDRDDHPSHRRVADEIQQMTTMAFVTPSIFLAVSAFLFNIVFGRLVHQQKEQIATLRAFGYLPREVGAHYFKMVLVLVILGAIVGITAGLWLSEWMLEQFARFFRFPEITSIFNYRSAIFAVSVSALAAMIGTRAAIRRATRLVPAEAMRPEAPPDYRGLPTERLGLSKWMSPVSRMIVRRMETNRRATILSILGMALGLAVVVLGSYMEDTINFVVNTEFQSVQRQDATLTFSETRSVSAAIAAASLPGVSRVEMFRSVPARLVKGRSSYRLAILGLDETQELFRVLDDQQQAIALPEMGGLVVSEKLTEILNAKIGDVIAIEVLEGERVTRHLPITKVFPNYTNPCCYMQRTSLNRLLQEDELISGVFVSVRPEHLEQTYQAVKQMPMVGAVNDRLSGLNNFRELMAESTELMRSVNAVFATLIAFGVIYNCAMITLAERARDLASLRVMGFTRREAARVLLGEIALITLAAIPIGLPLGYGFSALVTLALDTETNRFPLVIDRSTYAYATTIILAAALVSGIYVARMVNDLDLISVLKVKQ